MKSLRLSSLNALNDRLTRSKLPLKVVLVVPLLVQALVIIGVVGYFSFRDGRSTAVMMLRDLGESTADQVHDHIDYHYLETPLDVNEIAANLMTSGHLPTDDPEVLGRYFWHQLRTQDSLQFLYFATARGSYVGAARDSAHTLDPTRNYLSASTFTSTAAPLETYVTGPSGKPTAVTHATGIVYNLHKLPWFQDTIKREQVSWSNTFPPFYDDILGTVAYRPIYQGGQYPIGVLGAAISFDGLSNFLTTLELDQSSQVFILDANGRVIATSESLSAIAPEPTAGKLHQVHALKSNSPVLRTIAQQFFTVPESRSAILPSQLRHVEASLSKRLSNADTDAKFFQTEIDQQPYSIYVQPTNTEANLDWLIVVAISESDVLKGIQSNVGRTAFLCLLILAGSIVLILWAAHWLDRPISTLNQTAKALTNQRVDPPDIDSPILELAELSEAFNRMVIQLETSIDDLRDRFRTAFEYTAVGMMLISEEGQTLEANTALTNMLNYGRTELEQLTLHDLIHPEDKAEIADLQARLTRGDINSYSLENRYLSAEGKIMWGALGMAVVKGREGQPNSFIAQIQDLTELKTTLKELEALATIDGLTQIANRRRFNDYLHQAWHHQRRDSKWLSLILIDIDHFKLYNDHYGHPQGDKCLYQVAQAIQNTLRRTTDLAARYGGEEFALILPHTDAAGAAFLADQVIKAIATANIPHAASPVAPRVTLSLGVSSCQPQNSVSPEKLVDNADQALYASKRNGRDRWTNLELTA